MDSLDDLHLIHRLETIFTPAKSWENSELQVNTSQLLEIVQQKYPALFSEEKLHELMLELHYIYSYNEYNNKYYWLVNLI
jgi:hypothetical protein